MATSLDILIRARDMASSTINGVRTSATRLDSSLSSTAKTQSKLGGLWSSGASKLGGLVAGAFAAKQVFDFGADAVKSAEDANRSMEAFRASLERTGNAAVINEQKFNDWLTGMGESIGQDDEDLRDLATSLTSAFDFSKLSGDATSNLMKMSRGIQDVSAATGRSAGLIKRAFITMANDPAGAITQFVKLGAITERQGEQFAKMAEKGKDAAVTQRLLNAVTERYAGAAEANTTASDKLATMWENMKESLGNFLLPLFTSFVDVVSNAVGWFRDLADGFRQGSNGASRLGEMLSPLVDALKDLWNTIVSNVWPALQQLVEALKPVFQWAMKLIGAFLLLQIKVLAALGKILGFIIGFASKVIGAFLRIVTWVSNNFLAPIVSVFTHIITWIGRVITWVRDRLVSAWQAISGPVMAVINPIIEAVKTLVGWIQSAVDWLRQLGSGVGDSLASSANAAGIFNGIGGNIPGAHTGGHVARSGLAIIHKGEDIIPANRAGRGGMAHVALNIDRRRFVDEADFEVTYGGL